MTDDGMFLPIPLVDPDPRLKPGSGSTVRTIWYLEACTVCGAAVWDPDLHRAAHPVTDPGSRG